MTRSTRRSQASPLKKLLTKGFEGRYSYNLSGGFALRQCRNSIRRYSAVLKREYGSQFPLLPLNRRRNKPQATAAKSQSTPEHAPREAPITS